MLKVTFTDVNMAATALNEGLAIYYYYISPTYIEAEIYHYIQHCWNCYYLHTTKACPVKDKKFCTTCGSEGHAFSSCTAAAPTQPACLNCKSNDHHTLAAKCRTRKDIMKKQDATKKKSTNNTPTYAAIAKLQADTTKLLQATTQPASTTITPPTCDVTKIHYCLLYAHMQNMAVPGSFNSMVELFALNNMPSFTFPALPPSEEILKFTKDLVTTSNVADPTPPSTSDVTPTTSNEKPSPPPLLIETDQSEASSPETSSYLSTEDDNEYSLSPSTIPNKKEKTAKKSSRNSRHDKDEDTKKYTSWTGINFCTTEKYQDMLLHELYSHLIEKKVKFTIDSSCSAGTLRTIELSTILKAIVDQLEDSSQKHLLTRINLLPLQRFKRLENGTES
nr:uncharacterized protein LOC128697520 [Cherax quadricarinatus]